MYLNWPPVLICAINKLPYITYIFYFSLFRQLDKSFRFRLPLVQLKNWLSATVSIAFLILYLRQHIFTADYH